MGFLLYQYTLCHLIWSGVKNIQCGYTILILVGKLNQLLPFINWWLMVSLSHMLPAAAFSLRFHISVSIVSLVLAFYDPNSDGCIPVWNELAGCECEPSFPSYCYHLVSGWKSTGTIREETRESLCVDDAPPLSNWGKANMIRPNLKDDQCLAPQRRSAACLHRNGSFHWDQFQKCLILKNTM